MSLIESMVDMLGRMDPDYLTVHDERCVTVRNRNARCLKCVEACTSGALALIEGEIHFEEGRCIGCGTCATVCPTSAIEIHNPDDKELIRQLKSSIRATGGHPVVACATAADAGAPETAQSRRAALLLRKQKGVPIDGNVYVRVPCLGRIDETVLLAAAAYGCHDITLVRRNCAGCPHRTGGDVCDAVVESARNLLQAFGCPMPIHMREGLPSRLAGLVSGMPSKGTDRRVLLSEAAVGAKAAAADLAARELRFGEEPELPIPVRYRKVDEHGTLSHFVPTRRTLIYNYLKHIGEPRSEEIDQRVIGIVHIDGNVCTSCRMCATFCPTGALMKVDEEGAFGVAHRSAACVHCNLCESICPVGAISVSSRVPAEQFMGKKVVYWEMERPEWKPNRFDSLFTKMHHVIGEDVQMCQF